MNPKSVAIIVVVAIAVAGISYGTYLMDSDDKLEMRDYLVVGDWVEYDHLDSGYVDRYTVQSVQAVNYYEMNVSDEYTVSVSYGFLFTIVDPSDENVEYLRSETVDTFLGNIECDVYLTTDYWSVLVYYVEPDTNLVLIVDSTDYDGDTYRTVMTGTSVFDPLDPEFVKIGLAPPEVGSTYTYEHLYDYTSDEGFISGSWTTTMTVDSVNEDGTLNLIDGEEPVTVEQFVSGLMMTEEDIVASTLVESKAISTQWGVMMCDVYVMPYQDPESGDIGERTFIVDPDTGIVIDSWIEMHDVEYNGDVWEDCELEDRLIDCDLILVAA